MSCVAILLLGGCTAGSGAPSEPGKDPGKDIEETKGDTGTPADPSWDIESSASIGTSPPVEDCYDGVDNDLDGLLDCDDDDCVDTCLEDCADGLDNDLDGLTDCDDDECIGASGCPAGYDMELSTALLSAGLAAGPAVTAGTGSRVASFAYGYVELIGLPWSDAAPGFLCQGFFYAMTEGLVPGYYGFSLHTGDTGAGCDGCDYHLDLALNTGGALTWFEDCPINALPTAHLGFRWREPAITRRVDGVWTDWYSADTGDLYYTDTYFHDGATKLQWMYDLSAPAPYTWVGYYAPLSGDQ